MTVVSTPVIIRSTLISRSVIILGKKTSIRLEPEMWLALKDVAARERCTVHNLCSIVQLRKNESTALTSAIRVFLMTYYQAAATERGHKMARHGNFIKYFPQAAPRPVENRESRRKAGSRRGGSMEL